MCFRFRFPKIVVIKSAAIVGAYLLVGAFSCLAQLPKHAVNLVRLRCYVLDKQQLVFCCGLPWRSNQSGQNAEASAIKRTAC